MTFTSTISYFNECLE